MNKRTNIGESLTDLVLETFRLNGQVLAAGNRLTKPHELTSARWQVMGAIHLAGRALTVAQIARRMGLTRQAVQRIVNDLQQIEMVELTANPDHKRAPLVALGDKGEQAYVAVDEAQITWINELANGLSERQVAGTVKLLKLLSSRLEPPD